MHGVRRRAELPRKAGRYLDAVAVLVCELALLAFFVKSAHFLGTVNFGHFSAWVQTTNAQRALTALFRLFGITVSSWLLLTTVVYGLAALSGRKWLIRGTRVITLPVLRRAIDALVAATMAASSLSLAISRPVPLARLAPSALYSRYVSRPAGQADVASSVSSRPVRINDSPQGRHLPHPGSARHVLRDSIASAVPNLEAPSAENGFAGLAAGTKVVVVQPGDCLSVLAQRYLGDWRLDIEIEALNLGREQPDGRALVNDHWIYPGWVLVMPPNAVGTLVVGEPSVTRDGARHAVHRPDRHAPEPTTLPAPRAALPGPAQTAGAGRGGAHPGGKRPTTSPSPSTVPQTTSAPTMIASAPTTIASPTTSAPSPVTSVAAGAKPERPEAPSQLPMTGVLAGVGALAAAGITWRLGRARREQAHARRRGYTVARNRPQVEAAERRARSVASADALLWADLLVRYLSALVDTQFSGEPGCFPSLVMLKIGRPGVEAVLEPCPKGRFGWFSENEDGTALVLDSDIDLEDLRPLAEDRWPAWPALVSVGEDKGSVLLFNLESAGALSVDGPPQQVRGVLASFALQLATQPWADEMLAGLYATGNSPLVTPPPGLEQLGAAGSLALADKLHAVAGARWETTARVPLSAIRASACEAMPHVVIAFDGTEARVLEQLSSVAVPERSALAVAAAGPYAGARWHLLVGGEAASLRGEIGGRLVFFDVTVGCDPGEAALLSEALGASADREGVPMAQSDNGAEAAPSGVLDIRGAPSDGEPSGEEYAPRGDVEVCLLGAVEVVGGDLGALESSRRMAALAVIAYLASHPRPVSADELGANLWPLDAARADLSGPQHKTVMNVVSRARLLLGYGAGGKERLVHSSMGYRLGEDVTCDFERFERLVARARLQSTPRAIATLRQALELVRGQPFAGAISSQFFEWVASEHLDFMMSGKLVDVAQELAELAFETGDSSTVLWAVDKGLQLEPTREEMFRLWMHTLGQAGRPAKVDEVYRRLKLVLRQKLHPLQEPQPESREVWRRYTSMEVAGT